MIDAKKELPEKASDLIELALADLEKVEKNDRYAVHMSVWHEPEYEGNKCAVCFAGAVMAGTLGCDPSMSMIHGDFQDERIVRRLLALDKFRMGYVAGGLAIMWDYYNGGWRKNVTRYSSDPDRFKADMREMATDLRKLGL